MGLGMGGTMMPIMSVGAADAAATTSIARGSTLMNIIQQIAASIGTALFSVLLTNGIQNASSAAGGPTPSALAGAFADSFLVAVILVAVCLVPALFLPRHKVAPVDPAAMMH